MVSYSLFEVRCPDCNKLLCKALGIAEVMCTKCHKLVTFIPIPSMNGKSEFNTEIKMSVTERLNGVMDVFSK